MRFCFGRSKTNICSCPDDNILGIVMLNACFVGKIKQKAAKHMHCANYEFSTARMINKSLFERLLLPANQCDDFCKYVI